MRCLDTLSYFFDCNYLKTSAVGVGAAKRLPVSPAALSVGELHEILTCLLSPIHVPLVIFVPHTTFALSRNVAEQRETPSIL